MHTENYTNHNRKTLFAALEAERQAWLSNGMSKAAIFYIHFGVDGKGGDYRVWLSERKHGRADHKYAPGTPVAIDAVDPENAWISSGRGGLDDADVQIDLANALAALTELQRFCFVEVIIKTRTQQAVAVEIGKTRENVKYALNAAKQNLKKYFS